MLKIPLFMYPGRTAVLLLPARGEKVGMRGRFRESELVEAPPHRAEFWFSSCGVALSPQAVIGFTHLEKRLKSNGLAGAPSVKNVEASISAISLK
jgi:hypothetical protein